MRSISLSEHTAYSQRMCSLRILGLLVIDEEQRFGVTHKEKIKQMKVNVDVLTLDRYADSDGHFT